MKTRIKLSDILICADILILLLITVSGILSFNTSHAFNVINSYGHEVKLYGYGIYAFDSYFRAPIFIGSDLMMLCVSVPLLTGSLIYDIRNRSSLSRNILIGLLGSVLYYAASIAFGITYNVLVLAYIALFSLSLIALIMNVRAFDLGPIKAHVSELYPSRGTNAFLIVSAIALFVAWLPDIIPTLIHGTPLPLIEVYTTEITYVLDMGIISPLMVITLVLLKRKDALGIVLFEGMLMLCTIIGLMLPVQTAYQLMAGIEIPLPVLIIKVGLFVVLAGFAVGLNINLLRRLPMETLEDINERLVRE